MSSCAQGMDGRLYHHYASADRMWYMPEHPGPYPPPAEPPSLEKLGILPPKPEPPMSPLSGQVSGTVRGGALAMHETEGGTGINADTSAVLFQKDMK